MTRKILVTLNLLFLSSQVFAESSGPRDIMSLGCHKYDNTCYMTISGNAVGPEGCHSTSVRWNKKDDVNGKAILTLVTAAFYAEKKITFNVSNSCYVNQATFPTFVYLSVSK